MHQAAGHPLANYPQGGQVDAVPTGSRIRVNGLPILLTVFSPPRRHQVARALRVSTKSVYQWRRAWRTGGEAALASKGPGGSPCKLDEAQLAQLSAVLDAGPAASGWDQDQRWTLARVATLVMRLFGVSYSLRGISFLLHRLGFTAQVPAHRAAERNEAAIAEWRAVTWAKARG